MVLTATDVNSHKRVGWITLALVGLMGAASLAMQSSFTRNAIFRNDRPSHPRAAVLAAKETPTEASQHLNLLHAACLHHKDAIIEWKHGLPSADTSKSDYILNQDDPNLLERLRHCPDVDIFLPPGIRGHGYCEDAVGYQKCKWRLEHYAPPKSTRTHFFCCCW